MNRNKTATATGRHIHIGHDYFSAGNLGDDLMVAGFLQAIRARGETYRLTCCDRHDVASQQKRFPEIEWYPRSDALRAKLVRECDVWLGLGDSPFQSEVSTWFLDHLAEEAELCRRFDKPMFFLGVGVNDEHALTYPHAQMVAAQAERIWTRDATSARQLAQITPARKIVSGADLAHLYLAAQTFASPTPNTIAWVLHFENRGVFALNCLEETLAHYPHTEMWWLAQEVRVIPGSELETWNQLPREVMNRFQLCQPDYQNGTMAELIGAWGTPEIFVSSRYHGALTAAWLGARVLAVTRNAKVRGVAEQLGISFIPALLDSNEVQRGIDASRRVPRATLEALAELAQACVDDLLYVISLGRSRKRFSFSLR